MLLHDKCFLLDSHDTANAAHDRRDLDLVRRPHHEVFDFLWVLLRLKDYRQRFC